MRTAITAAADQTIVHFRSRRAAGSIVAARAIRQVRRSRRDCGGRRTCGGPDGLRRVVGQLTPAPNEFQAEETTCDGNQQQGDDQQHHPSAWRNPSDVTESACWMMCMANI